MRIKIKDAYSDQILYVVCDKSGNVWEVWVNDPNSSCKGEVQRFTYARAEWHAAEKLVDDLLVGGYIRVKS